MYVVPILTPVLSPSPQTRSVDIHATMLMPLISAAIALNDFFFFFFPGSATGKPRASTFRISKREAKCDVITGARTLTVLYPSSSKSHRWKIYLKRM